MKINVAQLLKQPTGSIRQISVDEQIDRVAEEPIKIIGNLTLVREDKGILVSGILTTKGNGTCSRCLTSFNYSCESKIEEEFLSTIDINTGSPIRVQEETFLINEHHDIDLNEALYQYGCMSVPMKLLCREDCAGICPSCGKNLNTGRCQCKVEVQDNRWQKLSALRKEGNFNGSTTKKKVC